MGSGAGGGTVAARLAERGYRVVVLEAGGDARSAPAARMPEDYDVPVFHALASENPAMKWDFFVRHYDDITRQRQTKASAQTGALHGGDRGKRQIGDSLHHRVEDFS